MNNDIQIELHVNDFEIAKDFYGKLGFKVVWERKPEGFKGYLVVRRNKTIIQFWSGNDEVYNQPYFKKFPPTTTRGYGVEIVIPVNDVDEFYKKFKDHDSVVEELVKMPWGVKDFRMIDPFGYYLRITEAHDITDSKFAVE